MKKEGCYYGATNAGLVMVSNSPSSAPSNRNNLNAVISSVKKSGSPYVYIPSGEWYYSGKINVDSCVIYGEPDTVMIGVDGSGQPDCSFVLSGQCPSVRWITIDIRGATIKGGPHGITMYGARGGVVEGVSVVRPSDMAFIVEAGSTNCRIQNSRAINPLADAFHVQNSANTQVSDCYATQSGDDFFAVVSEQADASTTANVLFSDCFAEDQGTNTPSPTGRGCVVAGGKDVVFRNMTCVGVTSHGMSVRQETPYYYDKATDNVVFDSVFVSGIGHGLDWNGVRPYYGIYVDCYDSAFPISNVRTLNCRIGSGGHTSISHIGSNGVGTSNIYLSGVYGTSNVLP